MPGHAVPQSLVYLNGKIVSPNEAKVSVFDRGFLFGDGVYETGKSQERCLLFLEEHWARLRNSAAKLAIPVPWTDEFLTEGLAQTARLFGKADLYFRTIITRGVIDHVGLDVTADLEPTLVHLVQNLPTNIQQKWKAGTKLATSGVVRNSSQAQDPNIKTSNYLNSLLAMQDARKKGAEDAVMCDASGIVTEGTTFSVFGVTKQGKLITPSLGVGILDSITRRHLLEIARAQMEVEEGSFPRQAFLDCEECFIASSIREVLWVSQWDDRRFERPGEVTQRLHAGLRDVLHQYVATHPKY